MQSHVNIITKFIILLLKVKNLNSQTISNTISMFTPVCRLPVPSKERAAKKPPKTSCIANIENGEKSNLDIEIFVVPWRQAT